MESWMDIILRMSWKYFRQRENIYIPKVSDCCLNIWKLFPYFHAPNCIMKYFYVTYISSNIYCLIGKYILAVRFIGRQKVNYIYASPAYVQFYDNLFSVFYRRICSSDGYRGGQAGCAPWGTVCAPARGASNHRRRRMSEGAGARTKERRRRYQNSTAEPLLMRSHCPKYLLHLVIHLLFLRNFSGSRERDNIFPGI